MIQWDEKEDELRINGFFKEGDDKICGNPLPPNLRVKKTDNIDRTCYTFIISGAGQVLKDYKYDILRELRSENDWKLYKYYTVTRVDDGKICLDEFIMTLLNETTLLTLHIPY